MESSGRDTIKLAIRALMETVEASSKNIEVAVMEPGGLRILGTLSWTRWWRRWRQTRPRLRRPSAAGQGSSRRPAS